VVINTFGLRAEATCWPVSLCRSGSRSRLDLGATLAPGARPESSMGQGAAVTVPAEPGAYFHVGLACVISP